ncbi:MAG: M48 family metallopeptidase [Sedimentisphaerales bacterium]|nr:M48 family metallopeptidase [Sedimentisphaerales bacterium]
MPDTNPFIDFCEKIRFCGDTGTVSDHAGASLKLREYAFRMRSRGLHISPALTPKLHGVLSTAATRLKLSTEPEAYVFASSDPNAYAPIFGVQDRPLVVLTSGIIELLSPLELQFVIGHELGHLGLGHPGAPEESKNDNELECLKRLSVSRAAEVSADRVGLIATESLTTAANVMIKLASGLTSRHIRPDVQSFINQIEQESEGISREWELYQFHPSLPLRLWALIQFSKTAVYAKLTGQGATGISIEEADGMISEKLSQLGDGKLSKLEHRNFDLAVTWLGVSLVFDDEVIEENEEKLLISLIGDELAQKALYFAKEHGLNSVIEKLKDSLQRLDMNDNRIKNKLMNTYEVFLQRVNILEDQPKAYSVLKSFL